MCPLIGINLCAGTKRKSPLLMNHPSRKIIMMGSTKRNRNSCMRKTKRSQSKVKVKESINSTYHVGDSKLEEKYKFRNSKGKDKDNNKYKGKDKGKFNGKDKENEKRLSGENKRSKFKDKGK